MMAGVPQFSFGWLSQREVLNEIVALLDGWILSTADPYGSMQIHAKTKNATAPALSADCVSQC
jgi:hypothetical protein